MKQGIVSNLRKVYIFPTSPLQAGYDARSIFQRTTAGFEFGIHFLKQVTNQGKWTSLPYYLLIAGRARWIRVFLKCTRSKWIAKNFIKDLKSNQRVHFAKNITVTPHTSNISMVQSLEAERYSERLKFILPIKICETNTITTVSKSDVWCSFVGQNFACVIQWRSLYF